MTRVLIVDDHAVVQHGIAGALAAVDGVEVIGLAANASEAITLAKRTVPEVVVLDFRLPDMPGDELCRELRTRLPSVRVVMLTTYVSEEIVGRCARAGASAFITKSAGLETLRDVVGRVAAGEENLMSNGHSAVVKECFATAADSSVASTLTPQQERVLELTAEGRTYGQISERLMISESTVRFHIQNLKDKLGVRTKAELVAMGIRSALIHPADDQRPGGLAQVAGPRRTPARSDGVVAPPRHP